MRIPIINGEYIKSLSYKFKQDVNLLLDDYELYQEAFDRMFIVTSGQHPKIMRHYLSGEISLETLVVFETCLGFVENFDKTLSDPIWKDTRMKVCKYKPFLKLNCQEYKSVILDTIKTKL